MKIRFSHNQEGREGEIKSLLHDFGVKGKAITPGKRNSIKVFDLQDRKINIKSFKIPNTVNKFVYRFFRKSKAERSFNYAHILLSRGIGTPVPLAFAEHTSSMLFLESYYVSEHLDHDLTFREIDLKNKGHEEILRAFTRFTYQLHEKQIEFLDHSPGNTLIQIHDNEYKFFLVDLNRMNFKELNFAERMKNFSRLTPQMEMVEVMANEYSQLIGKPESETFEKMWFFTMQFQEKFKRKKELKRKLRFWKS
jgi:hypothetical protein